MRMILAWSLALPLQHDPASGSRKAPSIDDLRVQFEIAYDASDLDSAHTLIADNPLLFLDLFHHYQREWMAWPEDPDSDHLLALNRATWLAEIVDDVHEASGLLETVNRSGSWNAHQRSLWRQALSTALDAESLLRRHDHDAALPLLEEAVTTLQDLGDLASSFSPLNNLGACQSALGHYAEALRSGERALQVADRVGSPIHISRALNGLTVACNDLGHFDRAVSSSKRSVQLTEALGSRGDLARSLDALGNSYLYLGQLENARSCLERSLEIREQLDNPRELFSSLSSLGFYYKNIGQYELAISYHERSLDFIEQAGDPRQAASLLNEIGTCYRCAGHPDRALGYHERALKTIEHLGNPRSIARCLEGIGACQESLGHLDQALHYYERSLELLDDVGSLLDVAGALQNIGNVHCSLEQFTKAIHYHERALEIRQQLGNQQDIAASCINLGNCYSALDQWQKAIEYHDRALQIDESSGNPRHIAMTLNSLAGCYLSLGQVQTAINYQQRALQLRESTGNESETANSMNNLGCCYESIGEFDKALDFFTRSLQLRETLGNPLDLAFSLNNLALCYESLGQFDEALGYFVRCSEMVRRLPARNLTSAERASSVTRWLSLSARAARCARLLSSPDGVASAFRTYESLRSRILLESLMEQETSVLQDAKEEYRQKCTALLQALERQRIALARAAEIGDEAEGERIRAEIRAQEEDLESATRQLRRSSPALGELEYPEPVRLEQIEGLLSSDEALLVYALGVEDSALWIITSTGTRLLGLEPEDVLRTRFDALQGELVRPTSARSFATPARELGRALCQEALECLEDHSRWIVVPDGFLGFLPFEVLLTRDVEENGSLDLATLPYLLHEKCISYAPSASFLAFLSEQQAARSGRTWKKDVLLVGDALYGESSQPSEGHASRSMRSLGTETLERLEHTRREVETIARLLVDDSDAETMKRLNELKRTDSIFSERFDLLVGRSANESFFRRDLQGYRFLHLAVHGYFDPEYPWFSGLILSPEKEGAPAGFLSLLEAGTLRLDAELVFLAACETGQGELLRSEGIVSTARSFLIAGADAVVAARWPVFDDITMEMATAFYERLLHGTRPPQALREVKRNYLETVAAHAADNEDPAARSGAIMDAPTASPVNARAHPYHWASLSLWGR